MEIPIEHWERFCQSLSNAGRDILASAAGADPLSQAEGLRYLTRLLRSGIAKFVEYSDPKDPYLANVYDDHLKWGLDNPDSQYAMAYLDGTRTYEISGNVGSVDYFNITTAIMSTDAKYTITGVIDRPDVITDSDGNFRIVLGGEAMSSNWVPLHPESNSVLVRQTFADRQREREMSFRIRLISGQPDRTPLTMEYALSSLAMAGDFFGKTGKTFVELARRIGQSDNLLPRVDQAFMLSMGGDPNYAYFWGGFTVRPGEALLIHFPEVPDCDTWNLCLYDVWLASLDYTKADISLNKKLAKLNDDGSLTIVVAAEQPAHGNWLDTLAHERGNIMSRWINPVRVVEPQTKLVRLDEIDWEAALRRW
jgi:hypothetical protein